MAEDIEEYMTKDNITAAYTLYKQALYSGDLDVACAIRRICIEMQE